jgi:RNA polymerase sigma-70 factor (ECF subfamily)
MDRESVLHMDGHGTGAPFARWRSLDGAERSQALQEAVREAFLELRAPVYRYLLAVTGSSVDAEDLTQETFIRLFRELSRGGAISNIRSWLFRVAHNLAVDLNRAPERTRLLDGLRLTEGEDHEFDPAPHAEQQILERERVEQILAPFSPQERRCVELRREGLCYREIAEVLGIRVPTVQTLLSRAIRKVMRRKP